MAPKRKEKTACGIRVTVGPWRGTDKGQVSCVADDVCHMGVGGGRLPKYSIECHSAASAPCSVRRIGCRCGGERLVRSCKTMLLNSGRRSSFQEPAMIKWIRSSASALRSRSRAGFLHQKLGFSVPADQPFTDTSLGSTWNRVPDVSIPGRHRGGSGDSHTDALSSRACAIGRSGASRAAT